MKSFIPWMGGKMILAPEIIKRFPSDYEKYIEVFGGGASVLFAQKPSEKFEVYNDYNSDLVNLFQVVRDKPLAFLEALNVFPLNSRQEFYEMMNLIKGNVDAPNFMESELAIAKEVMDEQSFQELKVFLEERAANRDVQRAVTFFKVIRFSYGNQGRSFACKPINLANIQHTISKCSQRLSGVIIENKDFEELIKQYDRPKSFFYLDPPYYKAERRYAVKFQKDHERLRDVLKTVQGKWLLSYNDCPEIRELYKDFNIIELKRTLYLVNRYETDVEYGELLIANYDLNLPEEKTNEQSSLF